MANIRCHHPATKNVREYLNARVTRDVQATTPNTKLPKKERVTRDYSDFVVVRAIGRLGNLVRKVTNYRIGLRTLKEMLWQAHAWPAPIIVPSVLFFAIGAAMIAAEMSIGHRTFLDVITPSNLPLPALLFCVLVVPLILYLTLLLSIVILESLLLLHGAVIDVVMRIKND